MLVLLVEHDHAYQITGVPVCKLRQQLVHLHEAYIVGSKVIEAALSLFTNSVDPDQTAP